MVELSRGMRLKSGVCTSCSSSSGASMSRRFSAGMNGGVVAKVTALPT